jgi:hypothetical protein
MVLLEAPGAVLLMTQEELLSRVRADFAGAGLVEKLLAERRQASAAEDAGSPPVTAGAAA